MMEFKRLLVPVDFSAESRETAGHALSLARHCQAELEFLHVIHSGYLDLGLSQVIQEPAAEQELLAEIAERRLVEFLEALDTRDLRVTTMVRCGRPSTEILDHVESARPDLLVLGTQHTTGAMRFTMGNEAELVLRGARIPVLVVPASP